MALRTAAPATAAGNERVFSALGHQCTNKRGALMMGRAVMLAYVYFNNRAMDRKSTGPSADAWEESLGFLGSAVEPEEVQKVAVGAQEQQGAEGAKAPAEGALGTEGEMATQES